MIYPLAPAHPASKRTPISNMSFPKTWPFKFANTAKINRKYIHMLTLILGGIGFIMMFYATPKTLLYSFILIGISWGSILSMPYAMLSSAVDPTKMGTMMGLFNMFIVIPQIIAAVGAINFLYKLIGNDTIHSMTLAGISLLLGGISTLLITDKNAITD